MNNDLISREALKKDLITFFPDKCLDGITAKTLFKQILTDIDNAPTVEYTFEEAFQKTVCEQRLYCPARSQGEWNYIQSGMCVCPFCGAMPHKVYKNFCANCGADMRKGGAE